MKKSKGSVLLSSVLCVMLMLLVASILLELSYIGLQTATATARAERLRMAAESGIEMGIQLLKDKEGAVPSYPGNILNYSSPDGKLKYIVELYRKDQQPPYDEMYYITSKVSTIDGKYNKSYVVRINKESFKSNFFSDSLCAGGITIIGQKGSSFNIPVSASLFLHSPMYLQCEKASLFFDRIKIYNTIAIKADSLELDQRPMEKYLVYTDIPEDNMYSLRSSYVGFINRCRLYYYKGIELRPGKSEDSVVTEKLSLFKRLDNSNTSLQEIDNSWREAKANPAIAAGIIDESLLRKLSESGQKQIAEYIRNSNAYKLVLVKGEMEMPEGVYNNYIICCSGRVTVRGKVQLNNSSLLCSELIMTDNSSMSISCPLRSALNELKTDIAGQLRSAMSNYAEGTLVKFISWYDL